MVFEWIFRIGMIAVGGYLAAQGVAIKTNQSAIQSNTIEIEKINASRYTPADALQKERADNARAEAVSARLSGIEANVQVILRILEDQRKEKP
jgi:hypothetical protein